MWTHLPVRSLIAMQRREAFTRMGEQARQLLADGYAADADRVLDEMNERAAAWEREAA